MGIIISIIVFLVIFSLLIFVHELGHFVMAKRAGIYVQEFGMGLPPRIFGKKYGETLYSLNWIPFGGFVKLLGEDLRDKKALKSPRSFVNKSVGQRVKVIIAGVLMNFLLAFILLDVGFVFGIEPLIVNAEDFLDSIRSGVVEVSSGMKVRSVLKGSEAEKIGFRPNDLLLGFDQKQVYTASQFWQYLDEHNAREVRVYRDGKVISFVIDQIPLEGGLELYDVFELPRVRVYDVSNGSLADRAGFTSGDVIVRIDGKEIYSVRELQYASSENFETIYTILHEHEELELTLPSSIQERVVISTVLPDSRAAQAGLQSGDRILRVNDVPVYSFENMRRITAKYKEMPLHLSIERAGRKRTLTVVPDEDGYIGVILSLLVSDIYGGMMLYDDSSLTSVINIYPVQYSFLEAPSEAFREIKRLSVLTVQMFGGVVQKLIGEGQVSEEVAGPVGIAQLTHTFVKEGFLSLIRFTALLSLSLGVINILPIPALDGGRLLFLVAEVIRGKKADARFEAFIHSLGYALLMLLIILVTYNDIVRLLTSR